MKYLNFILCFFLGLTLLPAQDRPPNFVIIFCDDLGYGDLSAFGNPTIRTPNLDRMAAEGQKWTQFYVADPVCTPSRAALMTGRYPVRNGMSSAKRVVLFPDSAGGLPKDEVTIAEVLKQKGYATAAIGKWHLGHLPQFLPTNQGFDSYFGIPYSNDMDHIRGMKPNYYNLADDPDAMPETKYYNVPLMENEEIVERPADQTTITKRYAERAVQYIKDNKEQPFFLYLAHNLPHIPLFASKDFKGSSKRGLYGDVLQEIDNGVGNILQTIRDEGLEDNTIVVFSSDNGPWLVFRTHGGSAGPLRAGKGTTFEGGQRVPTIFWGPGMVKPGLVTDMGSTLDLINTFAALSGTKVPTDRKMDGYDLSPVLKGSGASPRQEFYYWTRAKLHAVRSGPWKLHIAQREPVNYGREVEMAHPELYNLEKDISEAYDRYEHEPEVVERLMKMLQMHETDTEDRLPDNLEARIKE
ncbi:sulfatase family protein [Flavilitoribacter nigricans]|uniref:Arylsulfatase n=1 Tax=Flavilitoribacter nigricans (strain ATCC 23147 / DSM 23189 / NBRC 102662 / NCIMB 1420 / SS-2) TaxID=1122177 RepID=A0A2D0NHZ1_FLAN2|nr:sulfatase [Flavilitoribacter nigricans]PHN08115.1 arylsulfatase [Flavilitoribacter nigricans DSM 23189 = NBRC 102662]